MKQISCENGVITEGAAYVPKLIKQLGLPHNRYISITPTEEFQISHFKRREFVSYVLDGCSDMERDILFAQEVQKQCYEERYASIINDGSIEIDELVSRVAKHFALSN